MSHFTALKRNETSLAKKASRLGEKATGGVFDVSKFGFFDFSEVLGLSKVQVALVMASSVVFVLGKFFDNDGIVLDHMDAFLATDYVNEACNYEVLTKDGKALYSMYATRVYMMFLTIIQIAIPLLTSYVVRRNYFYIYAQKIFKLYDEIIKAIGIQSKTEEKSEWAKIKPSTTLICSTNIKTKIDELNEALDKGPDSSPGNFNKAFKFTRLVIVMSIFPLICCAALLPVFLAGRTIGFVDSKQLPICIVQVPSLNMRASEFRTEQRIEKPVADSDQFFMPNHSGRIRMIGKVEVGRLNLTVKEHGMASHYLGGKLTQVYQVRVVIKRLYVKLMIVCASVLIILLQSLVSIFSIIKLIFRRNSSAKNFNDDFNIANLLKKEFTYKQEKDENLDQGEGEENYASIDDLRSEKGNSIYSDDYTSKTRKLSDDLSPL